MMRLRSTILLRIVVSQPLGRQLCRLLFYLILIFVPITIDSWLRTTTTYVSVHEYTFVRAIPVTFFVPADVYSQHIPQYPTNNVHRPSSLRTLQFVRCDTETSAERSRAKR
ncbi:hypothetical protein ARMSODRAFT_556541 [Armillaria solidipes]|uniref:Uncharacterized protein n=1 Tax=Armillaria solidipes TaxID=1076256 RepID=A0A2H3B781_9AGAR|nr:hypothetical protein ARMSODRAFT_556541 [Armillaria solidipes]